MQNRQEQMCQRRFDCTAYLNGHIHGDQKAAFEQHLCVCDGCFEMLITVLNRHLNQAEPWVGMRSSQDPSTGDVNVGAEIFEINNRLVAAI